jgi:hypothetical protein
MEAKKDPIIKCNPMLSVMVAKIKINTKKTANNDSLPFSISNILLSLFSIKFSSRDNFLISL